MSVQEARWDKGDMVRARDFIFYYGKGNENDQLESGFFLHQRIVSAVMRIELVSDRM